MGVDKITSRAVMGMLQRALSIDSAPSWVNGVSNLFRSDQAEEEYAWLGAVPQLREWIGGRNAKQLREFDWSIKNKHFETTLEVLVRDLRRDKLSALETRINEIGQRASTHWASMLTTLIENGESTACYDGQYFFDTDHSEGDSGTQDNDISVDISALPVGVNGTTTNPSVPEMQQAIALGVQQIMGFKDDQGEPVNETASSFLVMVPTSFLNVAMQAVATPIQVAESQTALAKLQQDFTINAVVNPRLTWTTKFALFRTDAAVKALIRQQETNIRVGAKAEGSEYEFDNDAHQYGIDVWRNVDYGRWQNSCLVTLA